jgi:hypothetical protein
MALTVVGGTLESVPCLQLFQVLEKSGICPVGLQSIQHLLACPFLERRSLVPLEEEHAVLRGLAVCWIQSISNVLP